MNRIPVFATIGGAYRFSFGRFFGNLGVVWAPLLLILAGNFFLQPHLISAAAAQGGFKPHGAHPDVAAAMRAMIQVYRILILLSIGAILLRAQIMLGLTQRALDRDKATGLIYLSLGRAYWRVVGAYFAITVIVIALYIALVVAGIMGGLLLVLVAKFAAPALGAGKAITGIVMVVSLAALILTIFLMLLYAIVRMTFFLTVTIVDQGRFDIATPWHLTKGNFWRIVVVGVAIYVPAALVAGAIIVPLELPALQAAFHAFAHSGALAGHHDPAVTAKVMRVFSIKLRQSLFARWYLVGPVFFLFAALQYGLATGASVRAYRALVPKAEPESAA